jgi:DNA-binding HxlR family transcriptional regulator
MVREIQASRKRLTKKAFGTDTVGGAKFTVMARKGPFSAGRYMVLVDFGEGRTNGFKGSFGEALSTMRRLKEMNGGIGLLRECAKAIKDPESTLRSSYTGTELLCLAALADGPMNLDDISDAVHDATSSVCLTLGGLQTRGLVMRCEEEGELPRLYGLTEKGKETAGLLCDERDFAIVRNRDAQKEAV